MYINVNILKSKNLSVKDVGLLQVIKQNKFEDCSEWLEEYLPGGFLNDYLEQGLVEFVKPKKKDDSKFKLIRLSKKGSTWLDDIFTPEVEEGDLTMAEYLFDMYLSMSDDPEREIGNRKLVKLYCAQFRRIVGLTLHEMYWLSYHFIQNVVYTKKLENIFFVKKDNPYGKFKDNIEASRLFQYYEQNKKEVEAFWKLNIKDFE
jgi:hypothetical protein